MHTRLVTLLLAPVLAAGSATLLAAEPRGEGFGLELRGSVTGQELEMPLYPNSVQQRGDGDDSGSVSMGAWGPSLGFRLVASKYRSSDAQTSVVQFYRDALARHGTVLECSASTRSAAPPPAASGNDFSLRCDDAQPGAKKDGAKARSGTIVLKVGVKKDFRLVAIEPRSEGGVQIDLVRLKTSGL